MKTSEHTSDGCWLGSDLFVPLQEQDGGGSGGVGGGGGEGGERGRQY